MIYDPNKVITITLYNRPDYTAQTLRSIGEAKDSESYLCLISLEPGQKDVLRVAESWPHERKYIRVNRDRQGSARNTYHTLTWAYNYGDFVIFIEDDIPIAPDALDFYQHVNHAYRNDPGILSATGYHKNLDYKPEQAYQIAMRDAFVGWGHASWKDRWLNTLRPMFFACQPGDAFDTVIQSQQHGKHVYPLLSRCQNIGAEDGAFVPSPDWHEANQKLKIWAGNVDLPIRETWHI